MSAVVSDTPAVIWFLSNSSLSPREDPRERSNQITERPMLTLVVPPPDQSFEENQRP